MKVIKLFSIVIIALCASLTTVSAQTESSSSSTEENIEEVNVYIPNAFTPNSDGLNDVLRPVIDGPELGYYEFVVLDRSGKEAFYSKDPTQVWNGTIRGEDYLTSPTVFVYFLKIQTVNGVKPLTYSGHIVLIR